MKKLILTVAVLMGVSAANNIFANDNFNRIKIVEIKAEATELQVKALKGLKFQLTLDHLDKKTYIAIKDASGEVFHSEYVAKSTTFSKLYDLSALIDGEYFFEVVIGKEKLVKNFQIATNVIRTATAQ
jgi:hypothetical protein